MKNTTVKRPRVLTKKAGNLPIDAIYVGRPSCWGNPFAIGRDGDRLAVIRKHQYWIANQLGLLASIGTLTGSDLVCFCAPLACHGHTLLYLANPPLRDLADWSEDLRLIVAPLADLAPIVDEMHVH